jgi:hypothetical protein
MSGGIFKLRKAFYIPDHSEQLPVSIQVMMLGWLARARNISPETQETRVLQ